MSIGRLQFPQSKPFHGDTADFPVFLIDDFFALEEFLMKPYGHRNLASEERIYNYRPSWARRRVENAFTMCFQVLITTMRYRPENASLITSTCCVLHNIIRDRFPVMQDPMLD